MSKFRLSLRQKIHFENVHECYEQHYYDRSALLYRQKFMLDVLLQGINLNGCKVADVACGSGHTSLMLRERFPDIQLVGLDISAKACADYRKNVGAEAYEIDLTRGLTLDADYDLAIVIGGLHHCVVDLPAALHTVNSLVKPGGRIAMYEPSRRFFLQVVRELWYRFDRHFDHQTEAALDHQQIFELVSDEYAVEILKYFGGPAFYGVLNSMILRIPLSMKPWLTPSLIWAETIYNRLPGKLPFPAFVARWKKADRTRSERREQAMPEICAPLTKLPTTEIGGTSFPGVS